MADTRSKSLFAKAMVREVDETFGSGIDKLEETIADQNAKIGERIHALLLLLRSRNAEEENLQVNARPASPQLSESPDFNRPEPKPNYGVNVTPDAPNASSLLSNRKYKIQRRISCEEIDERRLKGLCVFCEEPETPNHHLQHKNSGILMIDSEDHLSNAMEFEEIGVEISSDMWLSNSYGCELETGETDYDEDQDRSLIDSDLVVNEVEMMKKDLVEIDVAKSCDEELFSDNGKVFGFKIEECETDSGIEQNQLIQEQAEIMEQDWAKQDINTRFEVTSDVDRGKKVLSIAKICSARQLFCKRSQHKERLKLKKKRKCLKSWMFKYKQENERLWRLHNHVLSFPDFCDLRINRLVTTRKRKLLGGLAIVYVKYFVRLVVVGEVQAAMIIGTESDYQKETQISLSNIHVPISLHKNKECSKEKHLIQQVTSIGMDKQQQELNCDRDFGVERDQWCRALYANSETTLLNQDRHELCSENKGCLDCFQALVLNSITDSSSRVEEWMKAEPYSVKVNEMKMEVQIVDKEMSPSIAVLEIRMEEMIGSHAKRDFVFKQTTISYSQCIEHNFFGTILLRLQSKNWMFKFKTSSKDYKLQIEIKRWDVNNRVWDPGGSGFQEFERQAEATMTLWFWLNSQMWMRLRFLFSGVKKGSGQLILEGNVHISTQLLRFKWFSRKVEQPQWS